MKLFYYEWKKLLIFQKGWLVLLTALVLKLGYLELTDSPVYAEIELYREAYLYYLEDVKGALSEETIATIESSATLTAAAGDQLKQTYLDYYAGLISETECEERVQKLSALADRYRGMNALYEQYLYVRQNPENRYLVYPNGWAALLQADELDYFLLGTLLLLIVPLFCRDYTYGMDTLTITTALGSGAYIKRKLSTVSLFAFLLELLFCIEQLLFCMEKYGLPDAAYPLQSLEYFSGCAYEVGLGEAFLILMALRLFGAVFLSAMICFAAEWMRRYAASAFLILCMILIPYLTLSDSLQYRLPLPLGFLRAAGYLRGNEVVHDAAAGEETILFLQISGTQLAGLCFAGVLILFFCCVYMQRRRRNKIIRSGRGSYGIAAVGMLSVLVLSGCSREVGQSSAELSQGINKEQAGFSYNSIAAASFTEDMLSVHSPFQTGFEIKSCVYSDSEYVYYLASYTEDDSNIRLSERSGKTAFRVMEQSAAALEGDCIFEVFYDRDSDWSFLDIVNGFFLNDRTIWFVTQDAVWQVDRLTHRKELSDIPVNGNIAYDGLKIYYIDDSMRLSRYDPEADSSDHVGDIAADRYVLTKQEIVFSNLRDSKALYACAADGSSARKLDTGEVTSLTSDGDGVTYYVAGDNTPRSIEGLESEGTE